MDKKYIVLIKELTGRFDLIISSVLVFLMVVAVGLATWSLIHEMFVGISQSSFSKALTVDELQNVFASFLIVLIGLELIEILKIHLGGKPIRVELVFLVASIALARKIVITDFNTYTPMMMIGIAALIISLCAGYYLLKKMGMPKEHD
jgi:uncharacterized membrane protein (DUF373 family)